MTKHPTHHPTTDGALTTIDGRPALRFERRYPQPLARVWRAVTDPAEMGRWFPSNVDGDRAPGAGLTFVDDEQRAEATEAGEPTRADGPLIRGTVMAYDPPIIFSFTWGGELLRFELAPDGDETVLVFTHLLSHRSVAARNGSGWHACMAQLDDLLGADPSPADPDDGWESVYDRYLDRMGPPLGVLRGEGTIRWERATHVDADQVRALTAGPGLEAWGAADHAGEPLRWEVEPTDDGSTYCLTHAGIDHDAMLAATWHALLLQLDMYLAAGQLVPVDHRRWTAAYGALA